MKNTKYGRLGVSLAGLLLAWSGGVCSADLFVDNFDTTNDVTALTMDIQGGGTLFSYHWDSSMNSPSTGQAAGSGSLYMTCGWVDTSPSFAWQECRVQRAEPVGSLSLAPFGFCDWDIMVDGANSFLDYDGTSYGRTSVILQNYAGNIWGNALGNNVVPPSAAGSWTHYHIPLPPSYTWTADSLWYDFNSGGAGATGTGASPSNTISYWVDAVRLISPSGLPPKLQLGGTAKPGLSIWANSRGQYDRHEIYTDANVFTYAPIAVAPASYSFTISEFPTNAADSSFALNFGIVDGIGGNDAAPDWAYANVIFTTLQCDTNGIATWVFRWKTNGAQSNGNGNNPGLGYYFQNDLPFITNPTPIGTWTLTWSDATTVTLKSPSGNTNTFTLGAAPDTIDFSTLPGSVFQTGGSIFMDVMANNGNNTTNYFKRAVVSKFVLTTFSPSVGFTNDWTTSFLDTNQWKIDAGDARFSILGVPYTNAYFLKWYTPDNGFELQTNNGGIAKAGALNWSTNGVPSVHNQPVDDLSHDSIIIETNRLFLIAPATFPNNFPVGKGNLLYRLASPPF